MGEDESEDDANAANERLLKFLSETWRGNLGPLQAEMMWRALAFAGREVGRFFIPKDKSGSGKKTRPRILLLPWFVGVFW